MRFFTTIVERPQADPQERAAMLAHRFSSIEYQFNLLRQGALAYAFRSKSGERAILMYEVDTLETLDELVKRDPGWPYADTSIVPVVSTEALVREAQDYLGEYIFKEAELSSLTFERKAINPDGVYWLAYKEVRAFNPLLSEAAQNDVHRRTILAQKAHFDAVEFADDNPVGKAVGILVAEGDLSSIQRHVEGCEVFPDTVVEYTELLPLQRAWIAAIDEITALRRQAPAHNPFASDGSSRVKQV